MAPYLKVTLQAKSLEQGTALHVLSAERGTASLAHVSHPVNISRPSLWLLVYSRNYTADAKDCHQGITTFFLKNNMSIKVAVIVLMTQVT